MTASKQASKHTHAYAQCSHASVVLAQAHPAHPLINLRWYTTQGWTLLYFMIVNKYIPHKVRLNNDWVSDDQWLSRWRCSVSNLTQVYWREVIHFSFSGLNVIPRPTKSVKFTCTGPQLAWKMNSQLKCTIYCKTVNLAYHILFKSCTIFC